MTITDVHAHILTDELIDALGASGSQRPPSFVGVGGGEVSLALGGERKLGPIADSIRRVETRIADMDRLGIDAQVLAIPPILFGYSESVDVGSAMARISNDCLLDVARSQPDRFSVLASLPLQDAMASCAEIERFAAEPLVRGVQIGSHVNGANLDDASLEPVWERLAQHDLAVLVHPYGVAAADLLGSHYLKNLIGNPLDSTIAIASLIFGGVTAAHPDLRFCFVHGGGFAPYQIGRWDHGWRCRPEARERIEEAPSIHMKRMFFDTVTHDELSLRFLGQRVGWKQVVLGSDYPFDMATPDPVEDVRALGFSSEDEREVLEETAQRLLRPSRVASDVVKV